MLTMNMTNNHVINEQQFEHCRFKNNPPLSVEYIRVEENARDKVFTDFDEDAIHDSEINEEPYHEALKSYKVLFTFNDNKPQDEDSDESGQESKFPPLT